MSSSTARAIEVRHREPPSPTDEFSPSALVSSPAAPQPLAPTVAPARSLNVGRARPTLRYGDLPHSERPWRRLTHHGADRLTTEELLALVIGTAGPRDSVGGIANDILARAEGSLRQLARLPNHELRRVHGVGPARVAQLRAALELGRRWRDEPSEERPRVRSPIDVVMMLAPQLTKLTASECHLLVLDRKHAVSRTVLLSHGPVCCAGVTKRTVFRKAIVESAAALMLVHNHPNGDPTPSPEDRELTKHLVSVSRLMEIPMYDHVIVGRGRYVSFLEEKWL